MMNKESDIKKTLSVLVDNIRERRRVLGLTQEELAERAGLSVNYVSKIEIGLKIPALSTTIRLAKALEREASDLLADENTQWADEVQGLAFALRSLPDKEAEYLIKQFHGVIEHSKKLLRE